MGRIVRILFTILLAVAAAGCDRVYTAKPIGKTPVSLSPKSWDGLWIGELDREFEESDENYSVPVVIKVFDEERGILQVWIMMEDGKKYAVRAMTIHVRAYGQTLFVSWLDPEDPASDNYLWGVISRSGGKMVLHLPDPRRFHALVEDNTLPGTRSPGGDVRLGELSDDQLKRIARSGDLFIRNPIVFTRWESQARPAAFPPAPEKDMKRSNEVPSPGAPSGAKYDRWYPKPGQPLLPPASAITIVDFRTGQSSSRTWEEVPGLNWSREYSARPSEEKILIPDGEMKMLLGSLARPVAFGPRLMSFTPTDIYKPGVGFAWNVGPISGVLPGLVEFRGHVAEGSRSGPYLMLKQSGTRAVDFVLTGTGNNLLACDVNANDNQSRIQFRLDGDANKLGHHVVVVADYHSPESWAPDKAWGSIGSTNGIGLQCQVLEGDPFWYFLRAEVYRVQ